MKRLFFDDVREKPSEGWILARDVEAAQELMKQNDFDIMSLDHDIGYQMACKDCFAEVKSIQEALEKVRIGCPHFPSGTDLAKWMVKNLTVWPKIIIIHSANMYGAERMKQIILDHIQVPILILPYDKIVLETIQSTLVIL